MTRVYLSLGSNIDRERYLTAGVQQLEAAFGPLLISSVYESDAVGFAGDPFFNLVIGLDTDLSVAELQHVLKRIEDSNGRDRRGPRFSARTLDIDILTFGAASGVVDGVSLPRDEILQHAFVLCPLAELAPDDTHPVSGSTYAALWQHFDQAAQPLRKVRFKPGFARRQPR